MMEMRCNLMEKQLKHEGGGEKRSRRKEERACRINQHLIIVSGACGARVPVLGSHMQHGHRRWWHTDQAERRG